MMFHSLYIQVIPVVRAFKVLGLTFDDRLSWKGHLERLSADCARRLGLLRFLQRGSLGAERQPLLTLYKSLIRSRLEYGAQLFLQAPASRRARLDKVQNRALRIATGLPRNTAIAALQVETHVPPPAPQAGVHVPEDYGKEWKPGSNT